MDAEKLKKAKELEVRLSILRATKEGLSGKKPVLVDIHFFGLDRTLVLLSSLHPGLLKLVSDELKCAEEEFKNL